MTSLSRLQARTAKAAGDARATGQLSKSGFKAIVDGKISASDVDKAKKLLDSAKGLLSEIKREGATSSQQTLANREVKIASALYSAVKAQYAAQDSTPTRRPSTGSGKGATRPSRPSTSSGKGVSRPSTSSGKGVSRPARRTVRRPSTGSSKGGSPSRTVSRPRTSSTKGRPGGK